MPVCLCYLPQLSYRMEGRPIYYRVSYIIQLKIEPAPYLGIGDERDWRGVSEPLDSPFVSALPFLYQGSRLRLFLFVFSEIFSGDCSTGCLSSLANFLD